MATGSLYGSTSESTGLYGIGAASGGTYFEWFVFQDSATAPPTPTGGSWNFSNNTGTPPTGWVVSPPPAPVNQVWVSIVVVDSRNVTTLSWSVPGLMTGSGLPILSASGVPASGTGLNGQLYINTATTPQSLYFKQSGAWTQLSGSNLVDLVNNQTIGGVKTFTQTIQGDISGTAGNVSGVVAVANGGTGASTAANARTNLGLGSIATQNANAVAITGGSITGITDLAVADGGTGASSASVARTNLGAVGLSDTQTLTNKTISGASNTLTNIPNSALDNDSVNVNGVDLTLGAVQTLGPNWILPSYAGNAGKVLAVNPSSSDVQWVSGGGVGSVTSVDVSGGTTGLTTSGGPITAAGVITLAGTLAVANGGTGVTTSTGTGSTVLSTSPALTTPSINLINDTNGNEILSLSPVASATDYLTVKNGIGVGVPLHIQADGPSANIGLHIQPKGTGLVTITDGTDFNKGIRFRSSSSAAGVTTLIDAVSSAGHVVTLPDANTTLVGRNTTDTLTNKTFGDNPTFSAGVASGVAYLNGSKVLTTGSALTFNGTSFGIGSSSYGDAGTITASIGVAGTTSGGLQLFASSAQEHFIQWGDATSGAGTYAGAIGYSHASDYMRFYVASAEQMRLTSTGLGIGTSSPAAKLDVTGTAAISGAVTLSGGTANGVAFLNASKVLTTGSALTFAGTSLGINGASANILFDNGGAGGSALQLGTSGTSHGYIGTIAGNFPLLFQINSAEQMRLTSTGLGIGTSSPGVSLDVAKNQNATTAIKITNTDSTANNNSRTSLQLADSGGLKAAFTYINAGSASGTYIGSVAGGNLNLTSGAGVANVTIDSSGNLGLGVTPSAWRSADKVMQAGTGIGQYGHFVSAGVGAAYGGGFYRDDSVFKYTTTNAPAGRFDYNYTASGGFTWNLSPSGTAGNAISFTQAMSLDADGWWYLGTTSTSTAGNAIVAYANSVAGQFSIGHANGTSSGNSYVGFQYNGSTIGSITQSGTTAVLYNVTSDKRLKNDLGVVKNTDVIANTVIHDFTWKSDGSQSRGVFAQEAAKTLPSAVKVGDEGKEVTEQWQVDYSKYIPDIIVELQSLRARVAELEAK